MEYIERACEHQTDIVPCYLNSLGQRVNSGIRHGIGVVRGAHAQNSTMLHALDDNSEMVAHVRNSFCFLICLKQFIRSRAVTNRIFFSEKTYFLHACATYPQLPSDISALYLVQRLHKPR